MGKHDHRGFRRQRGKVLSKPGDLLVAHDAQPALRHAVHVDQSDKVDPLLVKAVPARAEAALAEAIAVRRAVVI